MIHRIEGVFCCMPEFSIRIKMHPLWVVMAILALLHGYLLDFILLFLVIVLHEIGHAVAAQSYGYRIAEIEIFPFGGVANLEGRQIGYYAREETIIALAGPFVNLLLGIVVSILHGSGLLPDMIAQQLVTINATIGIINLLPALPLDGGRIARAYLADEIGFDRATKAVTAMSYRIAIALMLVGMVAFFFGYADVGLFLLGVFLLISTLLYQRKHKVETLRFLNEKRNLAQAILPVKTIAISENATLQEITSYFSPDYYHFIYILESKKIIAQDMVLDGIFTANGWHQPIKSLL